MGKGHHPDLMCQVVKNNKFAGNGKNGLWQILLFREEARKVYCSNNLAQIGKAITIYAQRHAGVGPFEGPTTNTIWKDNEAPNRRVSIGRLYSYVGYNLKVFYCPSQDYFTRENEQFGVQNFDVPGKECKCGYYVRDPKNFTDSPIGDYDPILIDQYPGKVWLTDIELSASLGQGHAHRDGINALRSDCSVHWIAEESKGTDEGWFDYWKKIDEKY